MIIDTTISAMEKNMNTMRCLDERMKNKYDRELTWHTERQSLNQRRQADVREFLMKQGKDPDQLSYIAFRRGGKITEVHLLPDINEQIKEKKHEEHIQKMVDKFEIFMQFRKPSWERSKSWNNTVTAGIQSNRKNREPLA